MATGFLHKRGRIYYARYRQNGREIWKSLKTSSKEIAHAQLAKLIDAIEKQDVGWRLCPKHIEIYLKEYLSICEAEHSPKTVRIERQILNDFIRFAHCQFLHQVSADRVEAYKVLRAKEVSKTTVNRAIGMIKAFLNKAVALGYLERNPAQYVKRLKEEQRQISFLSDDEVKRLVKVCSPQVQRMIAIFLHTGMRLGELSHLRWKDIDFRRKQLLIQNQPGWTTKNYKPRVIPMHPIVEGILNDLPRSHDLVFPTRNGRSVETYIRAEILRYSKRAGVKASVKMFRSTFASNLVMSRVDIYAVSKLLGHHDVKITEKHYAHLTPDYLGNAISMLKSEWIPSAKGLLS